MYSTREIAQRVTLKEGRQWTPLFATRRPSIPKPDEVCTCLKYCVDKPDFIPDTVRKLRFS
jgi:hypothetical protein